MPQINNSASDNSKTIHKLGGKLKSDIPQEPHFIRTLPKTSYIEHKPADKLFSALSKEATGLREKLFYDYYSNDFSEFKKSIESKTTLDFKVVYSFFLSYADKKLIIDRELLENVISKAENINIFVYKTPILFYAIDNDFIDLLLKYHPYININELVFYKNGSNNYSSALSYAIGSNKLGTLELLLDHDAEHKINVGDIHLTDIHNNSYNLLKVALESRNVDILNTILNHPSVDAKLINDTFKIDVIAKFPQVAIALINKGLNCNGYIATEELKIISLIEYAINSDNKNLVKTLFASDTVYLYNTYTDENLINLVYNYLGNNDFLEVVNNHNLAPKILFSCIKIGDIEYFKKLLAYFTKEIDPDIINCTNQQGYGLASECLYNSTLLKFLIDNGYQLHKTDEIIPLKLMNLAKEDDIGAYVDAIIPVLYSLNAKTRLPFFNINLPEENSNLTIIDKIADLYNNDLIDVKLFHKLLIVVRGLGSAEPSTPISINDSYKLDFTNGRFDDYLANRCNIIKLLDKLYTKFPLTQQAISQEINFFLQANSEEWSKKEWSNTGFFSGISINIPTVISQLRVQNIVQDRINLSWDFEKVIGTIAHIVRIYNDETLKYNFLNCLSELKMCPLGKLMNLVGVVQNILIDNFDYDKINYKDFIPLFANVLENSNSEVHNISKVQLFTDWFYDMLSKTPSSQWQPTTLLLQSMINNNFYNTDNSRIDSYHYSYGLQSKIIMPIIEQLNSSKEEILELSQLQKLLHEGIVHRIDTFLSQFNSSLTKEGMEHLMNDITFNPQTVFGDFSSADWQLIKKHYERMANDDLQKGKIFLKLLSVNSVLASEVTKNIEAQLSLDSKLSASIQEFLETEENSIDELDELLVSKESELLYTDLIGGIIEENTANL